MFKSRVNSRIDIWTGTEFSIARDDAKNGVTDGAQAIQAEPLPGGKYLVEVVDGKATEPKAAPKRTGHQMFADAGYRECEPMIGETRAFCRQDHISGCQVSIFESGEKIMASIRIFDGECKPITTDSGVVDAEMVEALAVAIQEIREERRKQQEAAGDV